MTFIDALTVLLSALTLHRLWSYDLGWKFKNKPFSCPACMAFWCGLAAVAIWYGAPTACSTALAAYFPLRVWLWWQARQTAPAVAPQLVSSTSTPTTVVSNQMPIRSTQSVDQYADRLMAALWENKADVADKKTVVILTALTNFSPSYSVATAVLDNALSIALARPSWEVEVWTMLNCDTRGWDMPVNVKHRSIIPHMPWVENVADEGKARELYNSLWALLFKPGGPGQGITIITHDLMFVSWYTLFARAIHTFGDMNDLNWFHIPHSLPGDRVGPEWITTMPGANHRVVTVARGTEQRFADYYQIPVARVSRIPNVKDPRSWGTMSPRVRKIVTQTRLWSYDIVQVFPICTTRLEAKGFSKVVRTFALLNEMGVSAFLLVANPNAGGERSEKIIKEAKEKAAQLGLSPDRWAFTSDLALDSIPYGLSADEIKSLWLYGDVLVFPSMSEADSLVVREAQLCGQYIVGNADVSTLSQPEDSTFSVNWGAGEYAPETDKVCNMVATKLKVDFEKCPRKHVLQTRNLEVIGEQWAQLLNNP